jgi:Ni,Fe-hydrogenase I large subunit
VVEFDQANVREDVTHSFYQGGQPLHPFDGETIPVDPERTQAGQVQLGQVAALQRR